ETIAGQGSARSVWGCPVPRQAVFAISVAIHSADPAAALRAAAMADAYWAVGAPRVPATWAQVRAGAGIAYLMGGAIDGTVEQIAPILNLPPELRIGTVTGYFTNLDRRLDDPRYAGSRTAAELRAR